MTEEPNWNFIIPEGTLKINQPNWYDVDADKLTSAKDIAELLTALEMRVSQTCENFDKVKKFLIIPEKPKTLEEISQELDEKFEKLIEQYKRNSYSSTLTTERNYDWNFDRIIENFEYARENGSFPIKYTLSGTLDYSKLSVNIGSNISSPCFMVKHGSSHQGYYTIGDDGYYRFYVEKKPNAFFRFFVYKLMGFQWIDEEIK
jgi:hypothetical protein